jgi:hypothetical protein
MDEEYYDIRGRKHSSESSCERANRRYAYEEMLDEQEESKKRSEPEQRPNAEQAQLQFKQDVAILESSPSHVRLDYIISRIRPQVLQKLSELVFSKSGVEHKPARQWLVDALSSAAEAYEARDDHTRKIEGLKEEMNRRGKSSGSMRIVGLCYLGLVFIGAALVTQHESPRGSSASLLISNYAEFALMGLLITSPFACLLMYASWREHRAAKAAAMNKARLRPQISRAEQDAEPSVTRAKAAFNRANANYGHWAAAIEAQLRSTCDSLASTPEPAAILRSLVRDAEVTYPASARIDWSAIEHGRAEGAAEVLMKETVPILALKHIRPALLLRQLRNAGQGQLAKVLRDADSDLITRIANSYTASRTHAEGNKAEPRHAGE